MGAGPGDSVSSEILKMFQELRVETKAAINESVPLRRMGDRVTSLETESRKVQVSQQALLQSFQRLEKLVQGVHQSDEPRSTGTASSESGGGWAAGTQRQERGSNPESSVLLLFPFGVKKAFMRVHIQREDAPAHLHKDAVLTLPLAGRTGGLKFPSA